jgi:5'-nucleotidase / UDP-sugar diphosphatase
MKQINILVISLLSACLFLTCERKNPSTNSENKQITIFYTNDEHGWMEPTDEYSGAAGMSGVWQAREGYDGSDPYLVLSGGDMWTGPAISTWFEGEPMVDVMNQMGYDAAALGNHEFDFTVEVLNKRLQEMDFPVLAANIVEKSTGNVPGFVKPYLIKNVDDIEVGIIGLASLNTPNLAFPEYVEPYEFTDYALAVDKYAAELQGLGVDFILIIGHICLNEMEALVPIAKKYNIPFIGGGHCHQSVLKKNDGVVLAQTNGGLKEYIKVNFSFDKSKGVLQFIDNEVVANNGASVDVEVKAIVDDWKEKADEALSEEIGYCSTTIQQSSTAMGNMVCDSWLHTFPDANVSITNSGGIRQDISAGPVLLETIVALLPFNNSILKLELTGAELLDCIDGYLVGGMTTIGGNKLSDGTPIEANTTYTVLTTDYLYSLSSANFSQYDPTPENTSVNFRQPLIDWIKSLNTSATNPLNNYLDTDPRR